ncbi:MAG TPA: hypothetical protein VGO93_24825 [Candidatus Xenobia bacterium]|jgi:hypothetical protein
MSDDLKKLQEAMREVHGHIQDLQSGQKASMHELKEFMRATDERFSVVEESIHLLRQTMSSGLNLMVARYVSMEATVTALGGTFAGIEQILIRLISDQADLQVKYDAMDSRHADVLRRLEALEKRAS